MHHWSNVEDAMGRLRYVVFYLLTGVMVPLGVVLTSMAWPAWAMLGYWLLLQLVSGLTVLGQEGGGVAFWAHFGGFVAGAALVKLFARADDVSEHRARHWRPQRVGFGDSRDRW